MENEIKSHGKSALLLFKYLNDLDVLNTPKEHVEMLITILNAIPEAVVMSHSVSEDKWFITYAYFGYFSIGPGAENFD